MTYIDQQRFRISLRRKLLTGFGAGAFVALNGVARVGVAQQPPAASGGKPWRVGIVPGGPMAPRTYQWDVFFARMQALGYVDGKNVQYEIRAPEKEGASFDDPITALAAQKVNVIVATGNRAGIAAKRLAPSLPVVLSPAQDAGNGGLVASLGRPGGNLTGISIQMEESIGKRLQLLHETVPKAARFAILYNATTLAQLAAAQDSARQLGVQLLPVEVSVADAMPAAFATAAKGRAEALIVTTDPFFFGQGKEMGALALKHKLPSIHGLAIGATAGGLMAYGPSDTDYYRIAAEFVDKILRGAKPADLPMQQPTQWELVINLQTARALGITVPKSVLQQAERVIE